MSIIKKIGKHMSGIWGAGKNVWDNLLKPGIQTIGVMTSQGYANYKATQAANQANYDLWQAQNAYNTPAMQMQRLKEAGLNPNLAYGMADTGNAGTPPTVQPESKGGMLSEGISKFLNIKEAMLSLKSQKEAIKGQQKDNEIKQITADNLLEDLQKKKFDNMINTDFGRANAELGLRKQLVDIDYVQNNIKLSKVQRAKLDEERKYVIKQLKKIGVDIQLQEIELKRSGLYGIAPRNAFEAGMYSAKQIDDLITGRNSWFGYRPIPMRQFDTNILNNYHKDKYEDDFKVYNFGGSYRVGY